MKSCFNDMDSVSNLVRVAAVSATWCAAAKLPCFLMTFHKRFTPPLIGYVVEFEQILWNFLTKKFIAPEDDHDVMQIVVRAPVADDHARSIVLDEDDEEEIEDGVVDVVVEDKKKATPTCCMKCLQGRRD